MVELKGATLFRVLFERVVISMLDRSECPYNAPLPKVHTHMISYEFPNVALERQGSPRPLEELVSSFRLEENLFRTLLPQGSRMPAASP